MRLVDFNLSTADLMPTLPLFWEPTVNELHPVVDVERQTDQLVLIAARTGTPLTLDQLNARTRLISGPTQLYVREAPVSQPLFGYRLNQERLLFG